MSFSTVWNLTKCYFFGLHKIGVFLWCWKNTIRLWGWLKINLHYFYEVVKEEVHCRHLILTGKQKVTLFLGGPNIMLLFYGLKFHVCYFWGNAKTLKCASLSKNFLECPLPTLGSNLVSLTLVPVDFYPWFYRKSIVLTWAWVTLIRFAFSNRSTLDCIFKYMCFHDRLHSLRLGRKSKRSNIFSFLIENAFENASV